MEHNRIIERIRKLLRISHSTNPHEAALAAERAQLMFSADKLHQLEQFFWNSRQGRGIFKTVDENRELLAFLQKYAPDLLEKCPWIEGWLAGTDIFLVDIMMIFGMENERPIGPHFPRPWPGKMPVKDLYGYDIEASLRNSSAQ